MSELTLLLLRIGFLVLLWFFVFAVVYSLRADLFGVKVRRMPEPAAAAAPVAAAARPTGGRDRTGRGERRHRSPRPPRAEPATTPTVSRIVITSGPEGRTRAAARQ